MKYYSVIILLWSGGTDSEVCSSKKEAKEIIKTAKIKYRDDYRNSYVIPLD